MNKLAIVIPYYKIDFFEETIISLKNQSNQNFSIYIGNDCGHNDPLPIIQKHLSANRYVYIDYNENLGCKSLSSQWSRILKNVKEEWFEILGDDDALSLNFVEEFYKNIPIIGDINVIKMKPVLINVDGDILKSIPESLNTGVYGSLQLLILRFKSLIHSSLSEHIFKTEMYRRIGFEDFPLAWHTDDWFLIAMSEKGDVFYTSQAYVVIRRFEGSISGCLNNIDKKKLASKMFFTKVASEIDLTKLDSNLVKDLKKLYHNKWQFIDRNILIKKLGILKVLKIFLVHNVLKLFRIKI